MENNPPTAVPEWFVKWLTQEAFKVCGTNPETDGLPFTAFQMGAIAAFRHLSGAGGGMRWIKASETRPDYGKLVIIRPIYDKGLAIVGADTGDSSEWATDSDATWWFDDTEWLYEPEPPTH